MHGHHLLEDLKLPTRDLRRAIPAVYEGFSKMHDAAFADGALERKFKELLAFGMAIVKGCDECVVIHARALAKLGATDEEVAETIGVAIVMDGGSSASGHGPKALETFRQFCKSAEEIAK